MWPAVRLLYRVCYGVPGETDTSKASTKEMVVFGMHSKYRHLVHAFIYGPPVQITREQGSSLSDKIAREFLPRASFQYFPPSEPGKHDFKISIQEKDGRRSVAITVGLMQGGLRFLVDQAWPESFKVACDNADGIARLFTPLVEARTELQLAEARLRVQVGTDTPSAQTYLLEILLGKKAQELSGLGNVAHFGIKYDVAPTPGPIGPLDAPFRQVTIEPLREENTSLYVEAMSNWGRLLAEAVPGQPGTIKAVPNGPLTFGVRPPSEYLKDIEKYLEAKVYPFLRGDT